MVKRDKPPVCVRFVFLTGVYPPFARASAVSVRYPAHTAPLTP